MQPRRRALVWAVLAGLAAGCGCRQPALDDPVLLEHEGQVVRRSAFQAYLAAVTAETGELEPDVRHALLEPFLEERVLVLEARHRGLVEDDASLEAERAAVEQLLAEAAAAAAPVSDADVEAFYAEHAEQYRVPEVLTLRQIQVPTLNEARDVKRRLAKDPRSFERLARSRSRAPEAATGGLMGTFARGELPAELEAAAFALQAGQTSGIVDSPLGYHVLRVDARQEARQRSLEESRPEIRAQLGRARTDASVARFVQGLRARAKVNHEVVKLETTRGS